MIVDLTNSNLLLQEAISLAKEGDVLLLENKTYYEKIYVKTKNITLIGKENTTIAFDAYHGAIIPKSMGGDGIKEFGTTGSATFTVSQGADGFKAKNITFLNYFKRNGRKNGQAVAFKSEINNLFIEDCKFISEQDTLYVDGGKKNMIKNCYIEGDVDFIFGSADCLFENCIILAKNVIGKAYYTAPDTYVSNLYGFIFKNCIFKAEDNIELYLGRAWFPTGALEEVFPKEALIDCLFETDVVMDLIQMHYGNPRIYDLKIKNCKYKDKLLDNQKDCSLIEKYIKEFNL